MKFDAINVNKNDIKLYNDEFYGFYIKVNLLVRLNLIENNTH